MTQPVYKSQPSFKEMMNDVVDFGSCCECGTCVLVCPHNVIEYIDNKPKQTAKESAPFDYCGISEGIGCDVCAQVCPRIGPREFNLKNESFETDKGRLFESGFGRYQEIYVARVKDPRLLSVCQDGGVVTAILVHGMESGIFDGAVVSAADPDQPCAPKPVCATTVDEVLAAAGSWYTYCPNDLALAQAVEKDCEKVAFVGVPCQVTPTRKGLLRSLDFIEDVEGKSDSVVARQTEALKSPMDRIAVRIGLLCSEVFDFEGLMQQKIEGEMGVPLSRVTKFNVKGEVMIYRDDGEILTIPLAEAQEHARPACEHCGDFTAEVSDISCGGVGAMGWTITITRTDVGRRIMQSLIDLDLLEVRPIEEFESSLKVLLRLARRQHQRVPDNAYGPEAVRPAHYAPAPES